MALHRRIADWLEDRWLAPAYSGWLMLGLALFFFGAATNTLAGWLYVMSGAMLALLAIAAILPKRSLRDIRLVRSPIDPVSAGNPLQIQIELYNSTAAPKTLLEIQDILPPSLGQPQRHAIEALPANTSLPWLYEIPTRQRGVYHWETLQLRTASPLGLFWCRRRQGIPAKAVVYPVVLPLTQCPLLDEMGRDTEHPVQSLYRSQGATEGVTRTLRPYRLGDSIRLVHWRTSARYGELRVRELEVFTGGQEILIGLDSAIPWDADNFEQAVIAAASLYFYALHRQLPAGLWTAATGLLRGDRPVLEALAATLPKETLLAQYPQQPVVWLTQQPSQLATLPEGSRWVLWTSSGAASVGGDGPGLVIQPDSSLQLQLQSSLR